jgi:hypothetical protein
LLKRSVIAVVTFVLAFIAITWWALESDGVAIVETRATDDSTRSTHVWYASRGDELWLEAGTPENPWFVDVRRDPTLTFIAENRSSQFLARPVTDASGHDEIRSMLREKYGFRDWWVGLLVDTSKSIAVRLVAAEGSQP